MFYYKKNFKCALLKIKLNQCGVVKTNALTTDTEVTTGIYNLVTFLAHGMENNTSAVLQNHTKSE